MYDDVLLPVALGSADEDPAVARGIDLANTYGATLHVVSVVDPSVYDPMTVETGRVHAALEESAAETLAAVADRAEDAGVDVHTMVGHGVPHSVVTDYAAEHDVDLIVMATHGREGLAHHLLGSTTERVVRTAEPPVLTVPLS